MPRVVSKSLKKVSSKVDTVDNWKRRCKSARCEVAAAASTPNKGKETAAALLQSRAAPKMFQLDPSIAVEVDDRISKWNRMTQTRACLNLSRLKLDPGTPTKTIFAVLNYLTNHHSGLFLGNRKAPNSVSPIDDMEVMTRLPVTGAEESSSVALLPQETINEDVMKKVLELSFEHNLVDISQGENHSRREGFMAILQFIEEYVPELQEVDLYGLDLRDTEFQEVMRTASRMKKLSQIKVGDNHLTEASMQFLLDHVAELPHITKLHIGGNNLIGDAGIQSLSCALSTLSHMQDLGLRAVGMTEKGLHCLAPALKSLRGSLRVLQVRGNYLGENGASELVSVIPFLSELQSLDLRSTTTKPKYSSDQLAALKGCGGFRKLGAALTSPHLGLRELFLSENMIDDATCEGLEQYLMSHSNCCLTTLRMASCGLTDARGSSILTGVFNNRSLLTLDLSDNRLVFSSNPQSEYLLGACVKRRPLSLKELDISDTGLSSTGGTFLFHSCSSPNSRIKSIKVKGNWIGSLATVEAMASCLQTSKSIRTLCFHDNQFKAEHMNRFATLLKRSIERKESWSANRLKFVGQGKDQKNEVSAELEQHIKQLVEQNIALIHENRHFQNEQQPYSLRSHTNPTVASSGMDGSFSPLMYENSLGFPKEELLPTDDVVSVKNRTLTFPTILKSHSGSSFVARGTDAPPCRPLQQHNDLLVPPLTSESNLGEISRGSEPQTLNGGHHSWPCKSFSDVLTRPRGLSKAVSHPTDSTVG